MDPGPHRRVGQDPERDSFCIRTRSRVCKPFLPVPHCRFLLRCTVPAHCLCHASLFLRTPYAHKGEKDVLDGMQFSLFLCIYGAGKRDTDCPFPLSAPFPSPGAVFRGMADAGQVSYDYGGRCLFHRPLYPLPPGCSVHRTTRAYGTAGPFRLRSGLRPRPHFPAKMPPAAILVLHHRSGHSFSERSLWE